MFILIVLDPRMKLSYYKRQQWGEWVEKMEKIVTSVYESYAQMGEGSSTNAAATDTATISDAEDDEFDTHMFGKGKRSSGTELDTYLDEPGVPLSTDPLVWWSMHENRFPTLARIARDYLAVPGNTTINVCCIAEYTK